MFFLDVAVAVAGAVVCGALYACGWAWFASAGSIRANLNPALFPLPRKSGWSEKKTEGSDCATGLARLLVHNRQSEPLVAANTAMAAISANLTQRFKHGEILYRVQAKFCNVAPTASWAIHFTASSNHCLNLAKEKRTVSQKNI